MNRYQVKSAQFSLVRLFRQIVVAMPVLIGLIVTFAVKSSAYASPKVEADDLSGYSDEFDDQLTLANWLIQAPMHVKALDINTTQKGHLYVKPDIQAIWYNMSKGVLLAKQITGDFVVTTRLTLQGYDTPFPHDVFSLAGLLVRDPRAVGNTKDRTNENWIYLNYGTSDAKTPTLDSKNTKQGASDWILKSVEAGWVELRVARIGSTFIHLYRFDGGEWAVLKRYNRPDLPETLLVGLDAIAGFSGKPDMMLLADYVRFRRPILSAMLSGKDLSDKAITDEQLLEFLGTPEPTQ